MALALTTAPGDVNLVKNPVYVKFLSTGHGLLDNYRVVLRVLFEEEYEEGTYGQIVETECIPASNGESSFDLSAILQAAMERTMAFQVPDFSSQVPYIADTLRRFKIRYLEKYGTPQVEQASETSRAYKLVYGGVDAHYFGLYDWFGQLDASNSLLTYYPSGKSIAKDQAEYLTHIRSLAMSSYTVFLRVRQYDITGTLLSQNDKFRLTMGYNDVMFLDTYQSGVFPTGPEALGISDDAVKYTVQFYAVSVLSSPGGLVESGAAIPASQLYAYFIDDSVQTLGRDVIWFGGFNNPHILRCTGRKQTRLAVERLTSEQVVPFGYDPKAMSTIQHARSFDQPMAYRSGPLKPDEKDALQELLIENKLLQYERDGNYYRLRLTDNNFQIFEDEQSPNYLEFNAVRTLAPRNYMRVRSMSDGAPMLSSWIENDGEEWCENDGNPWSEN